MTYSLIEPPDDLYSESALEVWTTHLERLRLLLREDSDNEGVRASLAEAEQTIDLIRRGESGPA